MTQPCQVCARELADGATFCAQDAHLLDADLADVTELRGLAYDLDLAITRQAVLTARDGGRPAATPIPYDDRAGRAARTLATTLSEWAHRVINETGVGTVPTLGPVCRTCRHYSCRDIRTRGLPADTVTAHAAFLRRWVGWLRHHPAGATAWEQITGAVRAARRVVDRPADRLYAGPCDCGEDLYARLDAAYVVCRNTAHGSDGVAWPVEERRRWLLRSAEDVLATTTEISRALTRYAAPVTPEAIRGYVHRRQLVARGEQTLPGRKAAPLYRLGDVLDILARQAERRSA